MKIKRVNPDYSDFKVNLKCKLHKLGADNTPLSTGRSGFGLYHRYNTSTSHAMPSNDIG
jgi:hypothetical protein